MTAIWRGALVQAHVVHALILRETRTRFGDHQLGYLWAVLEPIIWIASFAFLHTAVNHRLHPGMDMVAFLTTGIIPYELFAHTAARVGESINGNRALLFYPQVQPLDLAISRSLLEGATLIAVFILLMVLNQLFFPGVPAPADLLTVALGLVLASLLGASLGLTLCTLGVISNVVERIRGPIMRPLFWVSGLFFTVADLPPETRELALINPVLHVIELVRAGWFASYRAPHASPGYIVLIALCLLFLGLVLERAVRHRVELS